MMFLEPCVSRNGLKNANTATNGVAQQLIVRSRNRTDHTTSIDQFWYVHKSLSDLDNSV
jgi:hypothetical protein